jgi:predicted DNA-binding protein (MmcQ/YjbR family)
MNPGERTQALQDLLAAKPGAVGAPLPSAPGVVLYKVMGKMFAILSTRGDPYVILKSDPHLAEVLREQYSGVGHRSHLDRRFWISVALEADVTPQEIERLVAQSYDLICAKLTGKQKAELAARTA